MKHALPVTLQRNATTVSPNGPVVFGSDRVAPLRGSEEGAWGCFPGVSRTPPPATVDQPFGLKTKAFQERTNLGSPQRLVDLQPAEELPLPLGHHPRLAFTLIELLVTIGVIAVLVAISLPALRGARASAGSAAMLSNLRGIGVSFEAYTQAYDGTYPFHNREDWYQMSPPDEGGGAILRTEDPWAMQVYWPSVFHKVAPWREHYRTWLNPGREANEETPWLGDFTQGVSGLVSYAYSCSFMARPEAWASGAAASGDDEIEAFLKPVRTHEVGHPSQKALCFDMDRAYLRRSPTVNDPRGVLMADGSVSARLDANATPPVQNRVYDRPPERYHDTPLGVRGRDIR